MPSKEIAFSCPVAADNSAHSEVKVHNRKAKQIQNGMEAMLSVETQVIEKPLEKRGCVDDSEGGENGFCVNGKCR